MGGEAGSMELSSLRDSMVGYSSPSLTPSSSFTFSPSFSNLSSNSLDYSTEIQSSLSSVNIAREPQREEILRVICEVEAFKSLRVLRMVMA